MNKPIYENKIDFSNEEKLAKFLEAQWKCKMQRQRKFAQFDFVALDGREIKAFIEMRNRNIKHNQYPNCFISASKLIAARALIDVCDVPCLFVVSWSDRVGYADLSKKYKIEYSQEGWSRRNDPSDVEALVLFQSLILFFLMGRYFNEPRTIGHA